MTTKKHFYLTLLFSVTSVFAFCQNKAISFDGASDYFEIPNAVMKDARTIEFWFKPNEDITPQHSAFTALVVRDINPQNNNELTIGFASTAIANPGTLQFSYFTDYQNYEKAISTTNTWNKGEWYHIAAVIDANIGMILFVNGVQEATNSNMKEAIPDSDVPFVVGAHGTPLRFSDHTNRYFNGEIDDLHISKEAKYTANFEPTCITRTNEYSTALFGFNEANDLYITNSIDDESFESLVIARVKNSICPLDLAQDFNTSCLTTVYDTIPYSNNDTLILSPVISTMGSSKTYAVKVFPNPAQDAITITCLDDAINGENLSYQIVNGTGVVLKSGDLNSSQEENIQDLLPGLYLINILDQNDEISATKKLLIQ